MTEQEELIRRIKSNKYLTKNETDYIVQALEEIQKYWAIGTPDECRAAVEKQTAKKPIHKVINHGKHSWKRNRKGEIDDFAWDFDYHNGVSCEVCGKVECVQCNPNYDELTDCVEESWICPSCGDEVHYKYCNCGQKLDWSDEDE